MFKKIKWFFFYKKTLNKNRDILLEKHNIKIDWVYRMYKTYTFTDEEVKEIKTYGAMYVNSLIERDKAKIESTLINLNIHELVALIELHKLNEKQLGVAFRYKYFDTAIITNWLIWLFTMLSITYTFYLLNFEFKSIYFGLISTFVIYLLTRLLKISRTDK